ncbi:MAG: TIGR04551 family protein [Myxococcales bacterium]|nr:TIGR04551 family protein [Myxococcales bacterium]
MELLLLSHLRILSVVVAGALALPAVAAAQGLTPGRPGGMPGQQPKAPDKPAGPAEAAKKSGGGDEPDLPPLPKWPGQEHKKLQFFQLKGYFRLRGDLMHNLNLGQADYGSAIRAPYFTPIVENDASTQKCVNRVGTAPPGGTAADRDIQTDDCPDNTLAGANIRLRLEPTINVAEKVRVKMQVDVFDNLSMGSTPDGQYLDGGRSPYVPLTAFAQTQAPPIVGRNTRTPALLVKRVWAEIDTPLGQLRFGRMPSHWGLGLLANNGSCWDCNYGDNADRIMFVTKLFGHIFGMAYDFAASGPSNLTVSDGRVYFDGPVIDLEQLDDVDQLVWVAGKIDKPEVIKDKVEQGQLVLNYGAYLVYRKQDFGYFGGAGSGDPIATQAANLIERKAWALIPDLWFKLMYKKFYFEFEGVLIGGKIGNASDSPNANESLDILQFGFVMKSSYKLLRDQLKIGLEIGMASGDQAEGASYNRRNFLVLQDNKDTALNQFNFDFDYLVDLILFRELIGTVSNAIYFKPSVQYDLLESLGAKLDIIYSLAHKPVAFPGNSPHLGLEFDLDVYYRNVQEGFYAGLQYGILIPFAGLDRPATGIVNGAQTSFFGSRAGNASVAQTLQARLIVKF